MLKAIIFDCFGVIYPHSSINFYNRHKGSFKNGLGIVDELNLKIDLGEINRSQFFKGLEDATGIPASQIQQEFDVERQPDHKLVKLISKLKSDYKIALLSNAGKEEIDIIYNDNIDKLFEIKTVSYQVRAVKPNPEIFRSCLNDLDVKPHEALFVDDSQVNISTAEGLGIQVLHYPEFGNIPEFLTELSKF